MPGRRTASRVGPIGRGGTLRRGEGRRDRGSVRRPRGRLRGGGARRGRGCGSEGVRSRLGGREGGRRRRDRLVARPDAFRVFFPGAPVRPAGRCLGGGRGRSPRDRGRERARPGEFPRATTPPIVSTTRTNAFAAGRVGRGLPARGRPPREGGRAARRLGTTHRRAAKGEKSVRDDSGKPSREGGATPRAPPKRESTSRACLRVDRVDGRARVRSATPVLARATDRATIRSQTFSHAERRHVRVAHERQLAHPKTHEQTVSKIGISETFFFRESRESRRPREYTRIFFTEVRGAPASIDQRVPMTILPRSFDRSTIRSTPFVSSSSDRPLLPSFPGRPLLLLRFSLGPPLPTSPRVFL